MSGPSRMAGQQARAIKSLSRSDVAELRSGSGWGLAKAAELNGLPGPVHLLELREEISLRPDQVEAIERVYRQMHTAAVAEGERLIELESGLDALFRNGTVTVDSLRSSLQQIEASRAQLRYIHLSAHLETPRLLTQAQIERYNVLRGYRDDPCIDVPEGHDPTIWRKHNGCE